jgi:hypothetical protein
MIPKVTAKGTSFKGAAAYYLHDKQADTSERVAFTHTENLPTSNPDLAWKIMAHTADNQQAIKRASGQVATGRKLKQSVYAYSLSWEPGETPDQATMIEAGRQTIKALGLDGHQVLMVAHNDEPHPHIHLIVNRVHPETGIAAKHSNDHLRLSEWAEAFEMAQGQIKCEQRVENNRARREGRFVKDTISLSPAEFQRWRRYRLDLARKREGQDRGALTAVQKVRREGVEARRDAQLDFVRLTLKDSTNSRWQALYGEQKAETARLARQQRSAATRLTAFIKERARAVIRGDAKAETAFLTGAFNAVVSRSAAKQARDDLADRHRQQRRDLGDQIKTYERAAVKEVEQAFKPAFDTLADLEKRERFDLQLKHSADSQKRAMDIASGHDEKLFAAAKDLQAAFEQAAHPDQAMNTALQDIYADAAKDGFDPPAPDEDRIEDQSAREDDSTAADGTSGDSSGDKAEDQDERTDGGSGGFTHDEADAALRDLYRAAAEEEARREAEKTEDDERDPDLEDDNEYEIKPPGFTGPKP